MEVKKARCQCGSLSATATGDPLMIGVCHCEECQRRTGSAFGLGAYYSAARYHTAFSHPMKSWLFIIGCQHRQYGVQTWG